MLVRARQVTAGLLMLLAFPLAVMVATVLMAFARLRLADEPGGRTQICRKPRPSPLIVGLIVLALLGIVPILGFFVSLAALFAGLGDAT